MQPRMQRWWIMAAGLVVLGTAARPAYPADEIDWGFRNAFRAYIYAGTGAPPITASEGATCDPNPDTGRGGCNPKIGLTSGVFRFTATDADYTLPGGDGQIVGKGTVMFTRPEYFFSFYLMDPKVTIAGGAVGVTARMRVDSSFPSVPSADVTVLLGTFSLTGPPVVGPSTVTWTTGPGAITTEAATALGGFLTAGAVLDPVTIVLPYPDDVPLASDTVSLKAAAGKPQKRALTLAVSRQPALVATDFDPVADGAVLRVVGESFEHAYALPAFNWTAIVKRSVLLGYRYDDRRRTAGPITAARLVDGKLRIAGKGEGLLHDLSAEPATLSLVFQSGATRYLCVGTGGTRKFKAGKSFSAAKNPAPTSCPYYRPRPF